MPLLLTFVITGPIQIGQRYLRKQADGLNFEMGLARGAGFARLEHNRRLNILAAMPAASLFTAYLDTAIGVLSSLNVCHGPQSWAEVDALIVLALAGAFQWLALGLAIAILIWLVHRWLREQPDKLDHEMAVACLDLATWLRGTSRNLAMQKR